MLAEAGADSWGADGSGAAGSGADRSGATGSGATGTGGAGWVSASRIRLEELAGRGSANGADGSSVGRSSAAAATVASPRTAQDRGGRTAPRSGGAAAAVRGLVGGPSRRPTVRTPPLRLRATARAASLGRPIARADERLTRQRVLERGGEGQRRRVAVVGPALSARENASASATASAASMLAVSTVTDRPTGGPAAGDQFERDARHGEHVRGGRHRTARRTLRGRVGTTDRRAKADLLECARTTPRPVRRTSCGRDEDVARVQGPVEDAGGRGRVKGAGQLPDEPHRVGHGRPGRTASARRRPTRRRSTPEPGRPSIRRARGERGDRGGMPDAERCQAAECGGDVTRLFRSDVEEKRLDGDGAVVFGIVPAEDGAEHADTHLVHDAVSAEGRRRETRRRISGQRAHTPRVKVPLMLALKPRRFKATLGRGRLDTAEPL